MTIENNRKPAKVEQGNTKVRHFLDLSLFSKETLADILDQSIRLKKMTKEGGFSEKLLGGKFLAMIFNQPSTRTRVSFDVAMRKLGGETLVISAKDTQLKRGETPEDVARLLSRYVDAIMIRTLDHEQVVAMANNSSIPVINGLTRLSHPCQVMTDIQTFVEHKGPIEGKTLSWLGDSNNMLNSFIHASHLFNFKLKVATPPELSPDQSIKDWAKQHNTDVEFHLDPDKAAEGADCLITDTWVSMGDPEAERRQNLLSSYQVNQRLMKKAKSNAIFMHCLPAHRGEEVTADVIDGEQSVVFDEAENRMHMQKAILLWCFGISV